MVHNYFDQWDKGGRDMKKLLQLLEEDCKLTQDQLASMCDMPVEEVAAAIRKYEPAY